MSSGVSKRPGGGGGVTFSVLVILNWGRAVGKPLPGIHDELKQLLIMKSYLTQPHELQHREGTIQRLKDVQLFSV